MTLMIEPRHIWNVIYNAWSNRGYPPTSANTALATKNQSHDWSLSHMKRNLQCAEQQESSSNFTKYCACHEKWISWLILVTNETLFNAIYNARSNRCHCPTSPNTAPATQNDSPKFRRNLSKTDETTDETSFTLLDRSETVSSMIRPWSENDPSMKPSVRNPPRNRGYFSRPSRAFCIEKYNISRSGYHSKFHRILRRPRKVTLELHQILRLPRKVNVMINPLHTWNVIYNARSNKSQPPTSPNTVPATKNESHDWSSSQVKGYLQCAEQQVSLPNLTKYCACHATKFRRNLFKTDEKSFTMRGRSERFRDNSEHDPRMIRAWNRQSATRLATEVTFHAHREHFVWKNATFRAPAIIPNFTEYCACHEKWHLNFTKYCACHEKWHLNVTKCCTYHEKKHLNFTKCCTCHDLDTSTAPIYYDLTLT